MEVRRLDEDEAEGCAGGGVKYREGWNEKSMKHSMK